MKSKRLVGFLILLALLSIALDGYAVQNQGGVATDDEINQIKKNIAEMEEVTPPPNFAAQHRRDIAEMRINLRDKLQGQRRAMVAYLEQVRNKVSPERVQQIERDIQNKDAEVKAVTDELLSGIAWPPAQVTPPTAPPTGTGTSGTGTGRTGTAPGRRAPATVPKAAKDASGNSVETVDSDRLLPLDAPGASGAIASGAEAAGDQKQLTSCSLINQSNANQFSQYELAICDLVKNVQDAKKGTPTTLFSDDPGVVVAGPKPDATVSLNQTPLEIQKIIAAKLIGREERGKFLLEAEEARTDKQVDGGPSNSGSTSLVVKGGAPSVLGFAVANGALDQSRSGTTYTFRGNPIGVIKLLNNKTFDESYLEDEKDPFTRFLKKSSFSFSFDANRGKTPGVLTANAQQLSAYSVRYEFVNERDPRNKKHEKALAEFLASAGDNLAHTVFDTYTSLIVDVFDDDGKPLNGKDGKRLKGNAFKDPALEAWFEETRKLVAAAAAGDVEATFKSQLDKFPTADKLTSETRDTVNRFAQNFSGYLEAKKKLLSEIAKGSIITFEYTNNREVNAPDLSNFRFIAEKGFLGGEADLTANASLTIFNSRPAAGTKRIRDFQFAGQLDAPFKVGDLGDFLFSFAGKYQRSLENATALDGTVVPNTKGDIAVGQFKLTIPLRGTGIRLPISVTFANRTELIREKEIKGSFGFTFDLDKIFAKFKPF
jgi:hypothetical protein